MTYLKALREDAPLLDAYLRYFEVARTPFTIPGHKQRASKLDLGLGAVVDGDTPLYGGLDEIKLTNQTLKSAESLAAKLWGGDYARFSTGGSTHVNQAVILALGKLGGKIAVARTAHRSVLSALVLAGLEPIWLAPDIDAATGVPTGIPLSELERVLPQKPIALLLTEPGYLGTISQLPELISKAHEHKIPVVIDAAWGAHFGFHNDLPKHVLQLGADALITSTHKALPGFSASALLVARGEYLNLDRLEQSFETTHTTSPAGAPLASIDGCRALLQQRGEDLLAIAQTGTGKTAAFAIPIIDKIQQIKYKAFEKGAFVRAIVMVPTRELAQQITQVFNQIGKNTKVKALCVYGGVEQDHQIAKLLEGMDIIVSTPGRMFDLVSQGYLSLKKIEILILDEADQMLDLGFAKDIDDLVNKIPGKRQTLFFSATISQKIKQQAYKMVSSNAIRIQVSPKDPVSKNVNHQIVFVEMDDKRFFLKRLIEENKDNKFLVFVRTKVRAERVKSAMERLEIDSVTIHGDKEQSERETALLAFRTNACKVMIATDVSARGIDIDGIDFVINYDIPEVAENYVHRVGRTGRGRAKGRAISFCAKEEKPLVDAIEEYTTVPITRATVTKAEYNETIEFADDTKDNWKSLMNGEENKVKPKKKKRK